MVWAFLLNLLPDCAKKVGECIYNECANEICPLLGRSIMEYLKKKFGPNEGEPNAGQPEGQTERQANADQPGSQTESQSSEGQTNAGPSSGSHTNADQASGGEKHAGQPSGGETTAGPSPRDQTNGVLMISASDLVIEHSKKPEHWNWNEDPRFTKVAVLLKVWYFHIKAIIYFVILSANTNYGAYFIFKSTEDSEGLDVLMTTSVSVGTKMDMKSICLKPTEAIAVVLGRPQMRSDGWFELKLGEFDCDNVTADNAEIIIEETKHMDIKKAGLIVAGIEVRPLN